MQFLSREWEGGFAFRTRCGSLVRADRRLQQPVRGLAAGRRCAVPAGSVRLVAWIERHAGAARTAGDIAPVDYRRFLGDRLLASLVPGAFVETAGWPCCRTARPTAMVFRPSIRRAIPPPAPRRRVRPQRRSSGCSPTIWRVLLPGGGAIGVDDDFLALGGDSTVSLQVSACTRQRGWRVSPRDMFAHLTIAAFARSTVRAGAETEAATQPGPVRLTPARRASSHCASPRPRTGARR
ncbi:phosphopantetheine-binding protein [Burkholderia arboris]|uniref:phosphopantetheine-binding protein n=1 Tax=Burkholderia arboris TaxID=488730 RepID=UPI00210BE1E5|nr:phosphopantetheine-binding protein [Burkholderia arboris]UTV55776.1 phosphopantetheine-binding protein [Burkholderia arboris]